MNQDDLKFKGYSNVNYDRDKNFFLNLSLFNKLYVYIYGKY